MICATCGDRVPGEGEGYGGHDPAQPCWVIAKVNSQETAPDVPREYLDVGTAPEDVVADIKLPREQHYYGFGA